MKKQRGGITGESSGTFYEFVYSENYKFKLTFAKSLKGIQPELKLKTSDGATLLNTDPVSLILSLEESLIFSEILDWKLPSLSKRYLEACSELKCRKRNSFFIGFIQKSADSFWAYESFIFHLKSSEVDST